MLNPIEDGAVFFLGWPTWARLAIILGCSLVLVLILAYLYRLKNWAKDRKCVKREAQEKAERGEMALVHDVGQDIPFGIRSLLEDPEVEGIWHSREPTPQHLDGADSPPSFLRLTTKPGQHEANMTNSAYDPVDSGLVSPTALTPLTHTEAFDDSNSYWSNSTRQRTSLVISYKSRHPTSENARDVTGVHTSTTQQQSRSSTPKMQLRHPANVPSPGPRKFVIGGRQKSPPRRERGATQSEANPLEHMEAHRRLHSAESGQLLPRHPRNSDTTQATVLATFGIDRDDSDDPDSRALSWPVRNGSMNLGKQLSRRVQRMEAPKPVPFRAFVESLPTSKPPPSAWTDRTQARMKAKVPSSATSDTQSKISIHTPSSSISSYTTVTTPTSPLPDLASFANTRSRKVNSGFEVLPAGTLQQGPTVKEFGTSHDSFESQKKPKRLQKRWRSGSSSQSSRSSTESHRISGDNFRLPIF